ncbi:hypothetical protein NLI96_g5386 [Meripilus lineatus]|uniref:Uncharacterized protein n=1 Tax=Meripilus lineatus TaxID=2056292 RepID=A0AAD5V334_9APHY|nr:hypothetical protein NLI96_g5386 [Physisporinus lineatus]
MTKRKPKEPKEPKPKRQSKRVRKVSPIADDSVGDPGEIQHRSSLTPVHSRSQSPPGFVPASSLPLVHSPHRSDSPPFTQPVPTLDRPSITLDSMPLPSNSGVNSSPSGRSFGSARIPEEFKLPKQRWTHFRLGQGGRAYLDSTLVGRLNDCRTRAKPECGTFSIDNLDFPLKFGPKTNGPGDVSAYVCLDKEPIKVWIVGEIQAVGFRKEHLNCRRAGVLINTFRGEDRARMKDIVKLLSHPPEAPDKPDIWIGKWMAAPSVADDDVPPFTQVYDLCEGVSGALNINPLALKQYDVVCVEALINRYPKPRTGTNPWKEWRSTLELSRLFLLHSVEAGVRVEVDSVLF